MVTGWKPVAEWRNGGLQGSARKQLRRWGHEVACKGLSGSCVLVGGSVAREAVVRWSQEAAACGAQVAAVCVVGEAVKAVDVLLLPWMGLCWSFTLAV